MTVLAASRIHVALTLDRLQAVGYEPILGCWPSLLVVTSSASLQLDPAASLSGAEVTHISGRLLAEVARWHKAIRCHPSTVAAHNEGGLSWTTR